VTYGGSPEIYAGMMKALDDGVARVMQVLDELGYAQNTIVIFTSDNGGERFSDMGGLKGMKLDLWEGGIRVPAFVRWPGVIPAGVTTTQVATTLDWTATMLAAAGLAVPPELDGMDLMPHLRGDAGAVERTVFWRSNRCGIQHAVREGDWKYLRRTSLQGNSGADFGQFLFDVNSDPREMRNLAGEQPEVLERLRQRYADWEAGVLAPIEPAKNPSS
jgi:arylsulfatase A-like enzyme